MGLTPTLTIPGGTSGNFASIGSCGRLVDSGHKHADYLTGLSAGGMLWVDSVNGNDSSAVRGRTDKPFLTLTAAKTAAQSGDTIIVYPGTYNEKNLLKNGVNWFFHAGAVVQYTGTAEGGIFDDYSTGANVAINSKITGAGRFIQATTALNPDQTQTVVLLTNASSSVSIECDSMDENALHASDAGDGYGAGTILQSGGELHIHANRIDGQNFPIWWMNGECHVSADVIKCRANNWNTNSGTAIYSSAGSGSGGIDDTYSTGYLWVRANLIASDATSIIYTLGSNSARAWIDAFELRGNADGSGNTIFGVACLGNLVYLTADKIGGAITDGGSQIQNGGGELWMNIQKISFTAGIGLDLGGGTTFGSIVHLEGLSSTLKLIRNSAGNNIIDCQYAVGGASADGISHEGGTLTFRGTIDTSAASGKTPVVLSFNGLVLNDARLIAASAAADAITAASAHTVTCDGVYDVSNKGVHVNVTVAHSPTL